MRLFYSYFVLNRVDDDAEDVVMKMFSKTLHGDAKKWYDNLPDVGITSMDQFEEVFLEEWGIHLEDIPVLLKNFEDIKQGENETLFDFQNRCYPRYLGITRRSCLEAHMVLDMEYREQERLEHGPGGPIFLLLSQLCPVSSTSLHHYRPGLASERTLAP
jgi:hypothetical protein